MIATKSSRCGTLVVWEVVVCGRVRGRYFTRRLARVGALAARRFEEPREVQVRRRAFVQAAGLGPGGGCKS